MDLRARLKHRKEHRGESIKSSAIDDLIHIKKKENKKYGFTKYYQIGCWLWYEMCTTISFKGQKMVPKDSHLLLTDSHLNSASALITSSNRVSLRKSNEFLFSFVFRCPIFQWKHDGYLVKYFARKKKERKGDQVSSGRILENTKGVNFFNSLIQAIGRGPI